MKISLQEMKKRFLKTDTQPTNEKVIAFIFAQYECYFEELYSKIESLEARIKELEV